MGYKQYCKEPEKIENYEKAKKDNFKGWECHHRLETHNSDGKRREVDILAKELKALRMYYNRPPEELIFLTIKEHNAFNKGKKASEETKKKLSEAKKGKKLSEETRKKISEAKKGKYTGENSPFYGKHHSEEAKNKNAEAHKGKKLSDEAKKKIGEAHKGNTNTKGMHWFNNGKISKRAYECPEGFVPGIIKKP